MTTSTDRTSGTGPREPLLLLHGAAMSSRVWRPLLPALERHHEVLLPTFAGHRGGAALTPAGGSGIDGLVDELCADLDRAGLESVHVAGNSLGGWAALELARRGRARSVVALSPAGGWSGFLDTQRVVLLFRAGLMATSLPPVRWLARVPALRGLALRAIVERGDRVADDELDEILADFVGCALLDVMLANVASQPPIAPLGELTCPIRIAWSECDRVVPYRWYGRPLRRVVPTAEFVRLPGVGHVPMYDDPALVARTILEVTTRSARRVA